MDLLKLTLIETTNFALCFSLVQLVTLCKNSFTGTLEKKLSHLFKKNIKASPGDMVGFAQNGVVRGDTKDQRPCSRDAPCHD